jgi:hypothetical protein
VGTAGASEGSFGYSDREILASLHWLQLADTRDGTQVPECEGVDAVARASGQDDKTQSGSWEADGRLMGGHSVSLQLPCPLPGSYLVLFLALVALLFLAPFLVSRGTTCHGADGGMFLNGDVFGVRGVGWNARWRVRGWLRVRLDGHPARWRDRTNRACWLRGLSGWRRFTL